MFHEDIFYSRFKPYRHPLAAHDIWGGHGLETFGPDYALIKEVDTTYVWTVLEGSDGDRSYIVSGLHHVNRLCYLVTRHSHYLTQIEFEISPHGIHLRDADRTLQAREISKLIRQARSRTQKGAPTASFEFTTRESLRNPNSLAF